MDSSWFRSSRVHDLRALQPKKQGRKYTRLTCRPLFAEDKQKCTKKTTTTMTHFTFQWGTGQRKESHWNVLASTIFGGTQGGTRKQGQAS